MQHAEETGSKRKTRANGVATWPQSDDKTSLCCLPGELIIWILFRAIEDMRSYTCVLRTCRFFAEFADAIRTAYDDGDVAMMRRRMELVHAPQTDEFLRELCHVANILRASSLHCHVTITGDCRFRTYEVTIGCHNRNGAVAAREYVVVSSICYPRAIIGTIFVNGAPERNRCGLISKMRKCGHISRETASVAKKVRKPLLALCAQFVTPEQYEQTEFHADRYPAWNTSMSYMYLNYGWNSFHVGCEPCDSYDKPIKPVAK